MEPRSQSEEAKSGSFLVRPSKSAATQRCFWMLQIRPSLMVCFSFDEGRMTPDGVGAAERALFPEPGS